MTNVLKLEILLLHMPFLIFIGRISPVGAAKNLTKLLKLLFPYLDVNLTKKCASLSVSNIFKQAIYETKQLYSP